MVDTYRTIAKEGRSLHRVMASKHLGFVIPIRSEHEAKMRIQSFREQYHDAHHVCFAYRCGRSDFQRNSDDGEPSGTAGKPIAGAILSAGITQVLVVVVRYFGGTKLGTGGLIQAYRTAAQQAIEEAGIKEMQWLNQVKIQCDYSDLPAVMATLKFLHAEKISMEQTTNCILYYALTPAHTAELMGFSSAWKSAILQVEEME